jgi:putative ABC transport system ATP-binding protein
VTLEGQALARLDDGALTKIRRRRIGFVFQFFNLLPTLTVSQNIGLPLSLDGRPDDEVDERTSTVADRVGLTSRLDHYPQQLSGGEAQRAAIARAVIHEPAVLIADEPTGNLDSENGARVLDLLLELNMQSDTALLLATHDDQVAARAGRILYMRDGLMRDGVQIDS